MSNQMKKLLMIISISLVSIIVLVLIVRGISNAVVAKKFNAEKERMKSEGKHIEFRDFEIQCNDSENAALPWKEIEKMFLVEEVKLLDGAYNKVLDKEDLNNEEKAQISELIAKNSQCFERFKDVVKRPYFKYATSWDKGAYALELPRFVKLFRFMRLYALDSFLKAQQGKLGEAIDQCFSMLEFSRKILDEPLLITCLGSIAVVRPQVELLNRMISSRILDDETLFNVLKRLDSQEWQKGIERGIEFERAGFFSYFKELERGNPIYSKDFGMNIHFARILVWLIKPILKSDILYAMKLFNEAQEMRRLPYHEFLSSGMSYEEKIKKTPGYHIFTKLLVPSFSSAFLKVRILEAKISAARAGIACKIFKNRHGEFPTELAQLVPGILSEIPIDPFSGQPLIYRKTPSGFIVYSVGSNVKDDGGRETRTITKLVEEKDDDWAWYEETK